MFKNPKFVPLLLSSCCCRCCYSGGRRHGPIVDGDGRGGVGVDNFETLAFGPDTSPSLSLDPSSFSSPGPRRDRLCAPRHRCRLAPPRSLSFVQSHGPSLSIFGRARAVAEGTAAVGPCQWQHHRLPPSLSFLSSPVWGVGLGFWQTLLLAIFCREREGAWPPFVQHFFLVVGQLLV